VRLPRRILARACLCLILGFITTIAVAWSLAFAPIRGPGAKAILPVLNLPDVDLHRGIEEWPGCIYTTRYRRPGASVYNSTATGPEYIPLPGIRFTDTSLVLVDRLQSMFPAWATDYVAPWLNNRSLWPRGNDFDWCSSELSGWPFLCLYSREFRSRNFTLASEGRITLPDRYQRRVGESPFGFRTSRPVSLPYLPHIPSLAANSVLFAIPWYFLLQIPAALRTRFRRRRNLCPRCGYSRAGIAPGSACPECGAPPS